MKFVNAKMLSCSSTKSMKLLVQDLLVRAIWTLEISSNQPWRCGELQLVGATTLNEYRIIEKDAALERRMQPVKVDEPTVEETITILKGIQKKYETTTTSTIQTGPSKRQLFFQTATSKIASCQTRPLICWMKPGLK